MAKKRPTDEEQHARDILAAEEFVVPAPDPLLHREAAHDVLAADEFIVPARDPALHREAAHDVLAAEEFVVPARDPVLRPGPVSLPGDPTGIAEPHDVLAAEEFALPAPRGGPSGISGPGRRGARRTLAAGALTLLVAKLLRRRRT
jgi:hypothetical protein